MADESTGGDNGVEFDLDAVRAMAKEAGVNLLTEQELNKRLARERAKQDEMSAQLEAVKAQYEETAGELKKHQDKGKSDEQRKAEEVVRMEKQLKAYQERVAQEEAAKSQLQQRLKDHQLQQHISELVAAKAANPKRAAAIARMELDGLDLTEDGALVLTRDDIPYEGSEAVSMINEWWEQQHDLHRATQSGPPTGSPKPNGEPKRPYAELTDEERFRARYHGG